MHRVRLFAYGTLLDEKIQRRVFGRAIPVQSAVLPNWRVRRRSVHGRYDGIVPVRRASTPGGMLRIDARELRRADRYEGAPDFYRRQRVKIRAGRRSLAAWVYVPAAR